MRVTNIVATFTFLSLVKANTYFQKVGWISPSPSYGHIHLSIDLEKVEQHLHNMLTTLNHLHWQLIEFRRPAIKQRCQHFMVSTISELKLLHKRFEDYGKFVNLSPTETKRVKRFLGIILATASLAVGLLNTAQILHLRSSLSNVVTRQHYITNILQDHEVSIHNIAHNLEEIKDQFKRTVMVIEDIDATSAFMEAEIEISRAMAELHQMVDCIIMGTERLFMHRLPLCFTNATNLQRAHDRLTEDARKRSLSPLESTISSYVQFETSFILENKMLHIFVHVPLSDQSQNLELLQFFSAPIAISSSLHMQIDVKHSFLALNNDGFHTTLDKAVIGQCAKYSNLYFCNEPLILQKRLSNTCLGSIYTQNYTNLELKCPVIFFEAEELIEYFSPNTFMMYTRYPQTIKIKCQDSQQHVAVDSKKLLQIGRGCKVSTVHHVFQTGFDVAVDDNIQRWPTIWNISNTLFHVDATTLHDIIKRLNLIDSKPTPIRDLKKMIWMDTHYKVNLGISVVISIISVLLMSIIVFLLYRYCKITKNQEG